MVAMNKNLAITMLLLFCIPALGNVQAATQYYTAVTDSNVRVGPTINSHKITYLKSGKRVRVIGSAAGGKWHQVRLDSGQMGYVYARLLKASDAGPPPDKPLVGGPTPAPEDAFSYIVWPTNDEVIPGGDFVVLFGLHGMGAAPAGVEKEYTGHHHLLINTELPPLGERIPNDDNHVHFGRGQTEYQITLPPGTHTLQLLLGDAQHIPHTPPVMSEKITVRVP
jgi:hypothetical protein